MKEFSVTALAQIIKAHLGPDTSRQPRVSSQTSCFTGISTDSRTTKLGECFFAIVGDNFDGHDYVADAFAKGAACAVIGKDTGESKSANRAILRVDDTIKALGDFARAYRRQGNFKVVGITGSVGKTTTRQIAHHVLSQRFRVFQAPKNFNNNIGLPLTLLAADTEDEIVIVELGSNHPGEIAYLTRIALPNIALVTNVYPAHLAGFGNLQAILREKLSISEGLHDDGILIINGDLDQLVDTCRAEGIRFMTFGKSNCCDIQVQNIACNGFGSTFTIDRAQVHLPLPGSGNVENAVAAWSICSRFGLTIGGFAQAVKTLPPVHMRTEFLQVGTLTVLNDCYNANPASMKNALDIVAWLSSVQKRRLVFICGDMAELGQHSKQLHTELGASIAKANVQLLLAVGESTQVAAKAAKRSAEHDLQIKSFKDAGLACNSLEKFIKDYDIILVKGSRVAKLEIVVEKLKDLFSSSMRQTSSLEPQDGR